VAKAKYFIVAAGFVRMPSCFHVGP
jgi:hypothetical protein